MIELDPYFVLMGDALLISQRHINGKNNIVDLHSLHAVSFEIYSWNHDGNIVAMD
jgi:hypothetical protein